MTDKNKFVTLFDSSKGSTTKITSAMVVPGGCLVQVMTKESDHLGVGVASQALAFVPGVKISDEKDGVRDLVTL